MTHEEGTLCCPGCELKLKQTHTVLIDWFRRLKERHPSVHISESYRDQAAQNKAYVDGKSRAPWPKSKHNTQISGGVPCSTALDLFQIDADGVARWQWKFYALVDKENKDNKDPITWGGTFKDIKDGPHFELTG